MTHSPADRTFAAPPGVEIRPLRIDDDAEVEQFVDMELRAILAERPDYHARSTEVRVRQLRRPQQHGDIRHDLVAVEGDRVLGSGQVWMGTEDNLTAAWFHVQVDPDHRRRGLGSALLAALEQLTPPDRTALNGGTTIAAEGWRDHALMHFAEHHGYRMHSVEVQREFPLPVDPAALTAYDRPTPGYRVETYLDGVPEQHRVALGELKGLIDLEAPSGDMDWEAETITPEYYAEQLRRRIEDGETTVESIALDASGQVVAFSELIVSPAPRPVIQEGTLVARGHRGHGLGMAVKLASLRALHEHGLGHGHIMTQNAEDNPWMVAINEALGFVPVRMVPYFLKRR